MLQPSKKFHQKNPFFGEPDDPDPGLPISPHPRLSTSTHITIVEQTVTVSTSDAASVVGKNLQRQRSFSLELTVI